MNVQEDHERISSLIPLLDEKGLTASDLIDSINALANIKKRDEERKKRQEESENKDQRKFIKDKEFIYETRTDVFIYRNGNTKSGRYYLWIYDERHGRHTESLRTSNRIEALAKAEEIYRERKHSLRRGVKHYSINTHELIRLYQAERRQILTNVPHQGITHNSFNTLVKHLNQWEKYIESLGYKNRKIEDIPPEVGKKFGIWLKEQPKKRYDNTERSSETINHAIAAVKKMYRDIAIDERFITLVEMPLFRYLKVNKDSKPKRDILEKEEFEKLRKWMIHSWCKEKDIDELERIKRSVYRLYLTIQYYGGFRNKEILGIRWGDIKTIDNSSKLEKRLNRSIHIPAWNSKTGVSRNVVAPVGLQFDSIKTLYREIGIEEFKVDDYVFINLAKTKRGQNIPYQQPAMEKRLRQVVEGSGLQKILNETNRHVTQYSARHYAAVDALMRDVSIYDVAMNLGTSVHYIEKTYAKQLTAIKRQAQLTKGQSYWKEIEESQLGDLEMLSKSESRKNKDDLDIAKIAANLIDDGLIE